MSNDPKTGEELVAKKEDDFICRTMFSFEKHLGKPCSIVALMRKAWEVLDRDGDPIDARRLLEQALFKVSATSPDPQEASRT